MTIPQLTAPAGGQRDCFEGISKHNDRSSAASLHQAIQAAAEEAAKALKLRGRRTREFEVTRIQILVGNPNVKAYRVEISETG
jgi:flavin-binding protein dodecin